jgi:hypothetical protein
MHKPTNKQRSRSGSGKLAGSGPVKHSVSPLGSIGPDRLADAAVAALKARVEHADTHGGIEVDPAELVGTPEQPEVLAAFTRDEIVAACAFLRRIGVIEGRRRAA